VPTSTAASLRLHLPFGAGRCCSKSIHRFAECSRQAQQRCVQRARRECQARRVKLRLMQRHRCPRRLRPPPPWLWLPLQLLPQLLLRLRLVLQGLEHLGWRCPYRNQCVVATVPPLRARETRRRRRRMTTESTHVWTSHRGQRAGDSGRQAFGTCDHDAKADCSSASFLLVCSGTPSGADACGGGLSHLLATARLCAEWAGQQDRGRGSLRQECTAAPSSCCGM